MPRKDPKTREDELVRRFGEIEERYRIEGEVKLGEATPDELRELAVIDRELKEIRAQQPQEAAV
jgi:hypothetical protein